MKRNVVLTFAFLSVLGVFLSCGKQKQASPEPEKLLSVQVKLEGKAAEAFELVNHSSAAIDGIMLELTLKAKKSIPDDEIQLSYKTSSDKIGTIKIKGPLETGAACKATVQLDSGENAITLSIIGE